MKSEFASLHALITDLLKLEILVDGGVSDELRIFPSSIRLSTPSGRVLGGGVAIAPRWALSCAHLVRRWPRRILADAGDVKILAEATHVYWRSGAAHDLGSLGPWPHHTGTMGGDKDELILIRFDRVLMAQESCAHLVRRPHPTKGEWTVISGYGEDPDGNYPDMPRIAIMIHAGACSSNRGANRRAKPGDPWYEDICPDGDEPHKCLFGEPRNDDSGSPIYLPGGGPFEFQRLLGIHASRAPQEQCSQGLGLPPGTIVSRYIPVRETDIDWIDGIRSGVPPEEAQVQPARSSFRLRNRFCCYTFDNPDEFVGTWHLADVSADEDMLRSCDRLEIESGATGVTMALYGCAESSARWKGTLSPGKPAGAGSEFYWLETPGTTTGQYFVMLRTSCTVDGRTRRGIRVEYFKPGSNERRPGAENIKAESCIEVGRELDPCRVCPAQIGAVAVSDDQDEEGEGYED